MTIATDKGLSRRKMLAGLAAAGAIGAIAIAAKKSAITRRSSGLRTARNRRARQASLATAEIEHWIAEVGTDFEIAYTRMRLAGVRALPIVGERPSEIRQRPFIAVFELAQGESLPGNLVYRIAHRAYPAFDIFLAEPDDASLHRMLAVFN